jgi:predicted PurR-regulated permease PerM
MNLEEFPTPWQKKTMWSALAALSVVTIGAIAVGLVWLVSTVIGFLQPILIPFAVAGVMAYLLEPVVAKIVSWGTSRQFAVFSVFGLVTVALAGVMVWIIPAIWTQSGNLVHQIPRYRTAIIKKVGQLNEWVGEMQEKLHSAFPALPEQPDAPAPEATTPAVTPPVPPVPPPTDGAAPPTDPATAKPSTDAPPSTTGPPDATKSTPAVDLQAFLTGDWIRTTLPTVLEKTWNVIKNSVGGFLGVFGFLLSMIIVPIYLYYFLIESQHIAQSWGDYVPLRASVFKDEVVAALNEINGYLIAFFRGQLLVSIINGTATGILLVSVGLDFGLLIGLMLCFLGIIPYLGIALCWIPAVIIASVQNGMGTWIPGDPWWVFPLVVTAIFAVVQQIDGLFITPKIVGESVGLHPMTVIASVFVWSLLIGGLLGAILAVPLTATIKVLLRRYVWQRKIFATSAVPITEETFAVQKAQEDTENPETPASK